MTADRGAPCCVAYEVSWRGTEASAASTASMRLRAEDAVSSTATRTDGPFEGSARSMFKV